MERLATELNGFLIQAKSEAVLKNKDLWVILDKLTEKKLIIWKWVKAHAGNKFNEIADKLATEAINN